MGRCCVNFHRLIVECCAISPLPTVPDALEHQIVRFGQGTEVARVQLVILER
jgi:hypothetical protein